MLGVEIEEEAPRKKYDLDKEEEAMVRHEVKKRVESIKRNITPRKNQNDEQKYRKNRLVLSLDEIRRML